MAVDLCAFVDEFGNTNIETQKEGVSSFFIITAVLVNAQELEGTRSAVELVRKRFCNRSRAAKNLTS